MLLSGSSPGVAVETVAVLVSTVPSGTLAATLATTRMTLVVGAPAPTRAGRVARAQVTSRATAAHTQPSPSGGVTETAVVPVGSSSCTMTRSASEGPLLVTVRSNATVSPASTTPGPDRLLVDGDVGLVTHRRGVAVGVVVGLRVTDRAGDVGDVGDRAGARRGQDEHGQGDRRGVVTGGQAVVAHAGHQVVVLVTGPAGAGGRDVRRAGRDGVGHHDRAARARGAVVRDREGPVEVLAGDRGAGVRLGDREVDDGVDVGEVVVDVVLGVRVGGRRGHPGRVGQRGAHEVEVGVDVDGDAHHGPVADREVAGRGRT